VIHSAASSTTRLTISTLGRWSEARQRRRWRRRARRSEQPVRWSSTWLYLATAGMRVVAGGANVVCGVLMLMHATWGWPWEALTRPVQ
jgi:hypothetical protein